MSRQGARAKLDAGGVDKAADRIVQRTLDSSAADAFIGALARHRHFDRETDPPRV